MTAPCENCDIETQVRALVNSGTGERRLLCCYCWETTTATRRVHAPDPIVADVAAMLHKLEERLTAPPAPDHRIPVQSLTDHYPTYIEGPDHDPAA